jgi:hypothetical protein
MEKNWPFEDARDVAVLSNTGVIREGRPILLVTHDTGDGPWQFLDGILPPRSEHAIVVGLEEVVLLDPSVRELADLPVGWRATRTRPGAPWMRSLDRD